MPAARALVGRGDRARAASRCASRPRRRAPAARTRRAGPRSRPSTRRGAPAPLARGPRGRWTRRGRRGPSSPGPRSGRPGRSRRTSSRRPPPPPGTPAPRPLSRSRARIGCEPAPLPEAGPLEEAVERVDDRVRPARGSSRRRAAGPRRTRPRARGRPRRTCRGAPRPRRARRRARGGRRRGGRQAISSGHLTRGARWRFTLARTASKRRGVRRPVKVFCWETWKEQKSRTPPPRSWATPWPKARPRGTSRPVSRSIARKPSIAMRPRTRTARTLAQEGPLAGEVLAAARDLLGRRLVGGRRAAGDGGDVAVAEPQAVVAADRLRLAREPGAVEAGEQEVAGAVAGEDAAGAVAAVRGGGEAHDQEPRPRVAEAGHGPAPVLLVPEALHLRPRHLAAPARAGAGSARSGRRRGSRGPGHRTRRPHVNRARALHGRRPRQSGDGSSEPLRRSLKKTGPFGASWPCIRTLPS